MFSLLDVIVLAVIAASFAWGIYRQTVGIVVSWFGFYISALLAGLVDLLVSGAHGVGIGIVRSLGGEEESIHLLQVGFFIFILFGIWLIYHLMFQLAFDANDFPSFGWLDGILGGLLGIGLGILVSAVFVNLWRVTVGSAWQPMHLWQRMYTVYYTSFFPDHLRPALRVFNRFLPFFFTRQPLPLSL